MLVNSVRSWTGDKWVKCHSLVCRVLILIQFNVNVYDTSIDSILYIYAFICKGFVGYINLFGCRDTYSFYMYTLHFSWIPEVSNAAKCSATIFGLGFLLDKQGS